MYLSLVQTPIFLAECEIMHFARLWIQSQGHLHLNKHCLKVKLNIEEERGEPCHLGHNHLPYSEQPVTNSSEKSKHILSKQDNLENHSEMQEYKAREIHASSCVMQTIYLFNHYPFLSK